MPKEKINLVNESLPDYHEIDVNSIQVNERFRKDYGKINELADSINKFGLLQPIVISRQNELLAGGRRLTAIKLLKWQTVYCHYLDEIDELSAKEIELEENLARQNLTWQEQAKLTSVIDQLKRDKYGPAKSGRPSNNLNTPDNKGWGIRDTANLRGVAIKTVQDDLRLAHGLKILPSLAQESSQSNALKKLNRIEEDLNRELEFRKRQAEVTQYKSSIKTGDATNLILEIETGSIDLIITDPPYGVDVGHGGGHRMEAGFDDSPEAAMAILRSITPELRRVLRPTGHLYLFYSAIYWSEVISIVRNAGFDVREIPCIWTKPGGATGTGDWDHNFASAWEPFLFASDRQQRLNFKRKNTFNYEVDLGSARVHPTQKPVELIRELIQISSQPNDIILDPFCGSGSSLVAASQLRRRFLGFELSDRFCQIALQRLINEGREKPYSNGNGTNNSSI